MILHWIYIRITLSIIINYKYPSKLIILADISIFITRCLMLNPKKQKERKRTEVYRRGITIFFRILSFVIIKKFNLVFDKAENGRISCLNWTSLSLRRACVVSQLTKVRRFKLEPPDSSVSKFERFVAGAKEIPALFKKRLGKLSMQPETTFFENVSQ